VDRSLAEKVGAALGWKATQHAGTKVIFLIRTLILARLLSPDEFGLLAIATVAIGSLLSLTEFGMLQALVQREESQKDHYDVAWTVGIVRALAITGVVILCAPLIAQLFGDPRAAGIIQVLALRPLIEAAASIKVTDLTRELRFRALTFIVLPPAVIDTIVSVALASYLGVWALVAGVMSGAMVGTAISYFFAPYRPRLSFEPRAAMPLVRFGRWIFARSLVIVLGGALLQLVISRQLGTTALGLYFLAGKLGFLPYEIATQVIGVVAFPLYARLQSNSQYASRVFREVFTTMATLFLPLYALIVALAPSLVQHVLGARWIGTAPVIQLLAVAGAVGLFGDAVGPLLQGLGQPQRVLIVTATQNVVLIVFVWILGVRNGLIWAAAAWLPAIMVSQLLNAIFVARAVPHPFNGIGKRLLTVIAASLVGGAIGYMVTHLLANFAGLLIAAILSPAVIASLIWSLDKHFELGILGNLPRLFPQVSALIRLPSADG
jgi:O-antigen/teichoic acid export membrane protein